MRTSRAVVRSRFLLGLTAALFISAAGLSGGLSAKTAGRMGGAAEPGSGRGEKDAPRFRVGSRWLRSRLALDPSRPVNSLLLNLPRERARRPDPRLAVPGPEGTETDPSTEGTREPVSGTVRALVAAGVYSDYTGSPQDLTQLQTELFDGPWRSGTMSEYWDEVSFSNLQVTGDVLGWVPLDGTEIYYTGDFYDNGTNIGTSNTDEMIAEIVAGLDPSVDFGMYDNDGPDGIPNSGDDDGYVDIIVIVHPTAGAECNSDPYHMVSHSAEYSMWNEEGLPLSTEDPSANGGFILVDEYNMAPALSCDGGLIEIGVFCHEFGHFLGLPDLYDTFGRSGIGYWGLMGTGAWNTPDSPAHLCGWSREILGWAEVLEPAWPPELLSPAPVEEGGSVIRMDLPTRRFRRRENLAPVEGWSLICGYTQAEADARGYRGGAGYGNGWHETMERAFHADGSGPLTLSYDVAMHVEEGYDQGLVLIEGDWGTDTMATYTGTVAPFRDQIDLSAAVPDGAAGFIVRFVFESDYNFSDEDGWFDSTEGWAMNIDDLSVTGRGIEYSTDLEEDAGGWYCSSEPAEYFLVERRARRGFDSSLPGEGFLIYHAENSIAFSANGNSGGFQNLQARGVVVVEADNGFEMIEYNNPVNHGEASDPFPGSLARTLFDSTTLPSSRSNSGLTTPVAVSSITAQSAVFQAGFPMAGIVSVAPSVVGKSAGEVTLDVRGNGFVPVNGCLLRKDEVTVVSTGVEWLGDNRLLATFRTSGLYSGDWDLVVVNGDGREAVNPAAIEVESIFDFVEAQKGRNYVSISWILNELSGLIRCSLYRSEDGGDFTLLDGSITGLEGYFNYSDSTLVPGIPYEYRVEALYDTYSESIDVPGTWSVESLPFIFDKAWPNPFSGTAKVSIFLPERARVLARVYDLAGRRVDTFSDTYLDRGTHVLEWTPRSEVSSGVYFCRISCGPAIFDLKLVLLR